MRALHVSEQEVERALLEMIGGEGPIGRLLDIGTGTGRMLELMAPHSERSIGIDTSHDMLVLARAALGEAQLSQVSVRHGDVHRPPFEAASFDVAVMHHVLHLLDDPGEAIADTARLLRPGGRLLVADFAPHALEFLRERHGHRQLGIADAEMRAWAAAANLTVETERTLQPPEQAGGERLTVRLWLLRARGRAPRARGGGGVMASVSFEVFPPRSSQAEQQLWSALERLAPLDPSFVSVTCGAGGTGADATLGALRAITARSALRTAGHLTCVGRSRAEIDEAIVCYWAAGVGHIVALRGDMPELGARFAPHPGGYASSTELIAAVQRIAQFEVSVSAYPEPHPESRSLRGDLELLARKADAGASRAITQFCFRTEAIVRLRDNVARAGIALPIVPGIMFATNFAATQRMAARCGASVPDWLAGRFDGLDDDLDTRKLVAAMVAAEQVAQLRRDGFEEFHFYTLNRADVVGALCRLLDERPGRGKRGAGSA